MEHSEEFLNIISFKSLYNAHRRARLGKRGKKEVIEFEMNLSQNLWALHYDLLYGKYHIGEYRRFRIYDPKEREIQAISYRDRIIQHSICDNYLIPILERKLFYYNVACRKNKGTDCAVSTLRRYMVNHYKKFGKSGYFVKIDIRKYFDSISHTVLKKKLSKLNNILIYLHNIFLSKKIPPAHARGIFTTRSDKNTKDVFILNFTIIFYNIYLLLSIPIFRKNACFMKFLFKKLCLYIKYMV